MWEKVLVFVLEEHRGKSIGILLGLIASILFISFGILKTLFIILCIIIGYLFGKGLDDKKSFDKWIKHLFNDK